VLEAADLRGIDSHGVARLHTYFELLVAGAINPKPHIRVIHETPSTATVDGDNGLGLIVGPRANAIAIAKAKTVGSGWVAVQNTNHYGIAGYYPLKAIEEDMIGMSMTNTTALVAPCFGAAKMLGTNPIAIGVPAGEEPYVLIDMATSAVAYGKVEIADRTGKSMPEGWCIDKDGVMTTDPKRMKAGGALLPLGSDRERSSHKGYCMSAFVDIMCGPLSGANWGPFTPPFALRDKVVVGAKTASEKRVGKGIGHFFGAWRVDAFRPADEFKGQMDEWIRTFRASKAVPGRKVLIPGDPEREALEVRSVSGVPLTEAVVADLEDISETTGVPFDRKLFSVDSV
jgi:L-2-hydroxycarboxylate dehydrogenase (NAD+)